jgi:hypothetical protein
MSYNAHLISIWNGGIKIQTSCNFDEKTRIVRDVEPIDPHVFDALIADYVIYKDEIFRDYQFA